VVSCCVEVSHLEFGVRGVNVPDEDEGVDCGFEGVRGGWGEEGFDEVFAGLGAVPSGAETESEASRVWRGSVDEQRGEWVMETNRSP